MVSLFNISAGELRKLVEQGKLGLTGREKRALLAFLSTLRNDTRLTVHDGGLLEVEGGHKYTFLGKTVVDKLSEYKSGYYKKHMALSETQTGSISIAHDVNAVNIQQGLTPQTDVVTAVSRAMGLIRQGKYAEAEKELKGILNRFGREEIVKKFLGTLMTGYGEKLSESDQYIKTSSVGIDGRAGGYMKAGMQALGTGGGVEIAANINARHERAFRGTSSKETSVNPYYQELKSALNYSSMYLSVADKAKTTGDEKKYKENLENAAKVLYDEVQQLSFKKEYLSLAKRYGIESTAAYQIAEKIMDAVRSRHKLTLKEVNEYARSILEMGGIKVGEGENKEEKINSFAQDLYSLTEQFGIAAGREDYLNKVQSIASQNNLYADKPGIIAAVADWTYKHGIDDPDKIRNALEFLHKKGVSSVGEANRILYDKTSGDF